MAYSPSLVLVLMGNAVIAIVLVAVSLLGGLVNKTFNEQTSRSSFWFPLSGPAQAFYCICGLGVLAGACVCLNVFILRWVFGWLAPSSLGSDAHLIQFAPAGVASLLAPFAFIHNASTGLVFISATLAAILVAGCLQLFALFVRYPRIRLESVMKSVIMVYTLCWFV